MATLGKAVQFRGISDAVNAYKNADIPKWALFQGTQFLLKYEGDSITEGTDVLEKFLRSFDQRSANTTTYTLCVYDELPGGAKIKSNTPYDASFNFRLHDDLNEYMGERQNGGLMQRIAGIEEKLNLVLAPAADEEQEPTAKEKLLDGLGKLLEHPSVQNLLASKLVEIVEGATGAITGMFKKVSPRPAGIAGTATVNETMDENQKLQEAINVLASIDPKLGTNLLKLANVASADPGKYNNLISMLNLL